MEKNRQDIAYFVSFCIEQYKNAKGLTGAESIKVLDDYGVLKHNGLSAVNAPARRTAAKAENKNVVSWYLCFKNYIASCSKSVQKGRLLHR